MSSYAITFYSRDDLTFGTDDDGNFTVTVNEGATPDTLKIVDNDDGEGGNTFSGSTAAEETGQTAYGDSGDASFDGDAIQPLAALPGQDNPDDQVMAIGVGDPMHTVGYGFTFEPTPGEPMTFNYSKLESEPSYDSETLYVAGEGGDASKPSDTKEAGSDASAVSQGSDPSNGASSSSGSSGASAGDETSGASGGDSGASGGSGISRPSEASESSGASGGSRASESSGSSQASGSSEPSGTSGASAPSKTSGASGGSGSSGSSGGSGPSGGGSGPSDPPCFTRGTAIRTARGDVLVEDLIAGDMVWTESHGHQPIRWICQREVPALGAFAPIRICAGALGANRDILVSPAHRMLVQSPAMEVIFGLPKALVAAKDLVNDTTIRRETRLKTVEYFHILFDQHEVLQAHGTLSESFFPHADVLDGFGGEQRTELFALFPELEAGCHKYSIAYPGLLAHETAIFMGQSS